jgi:hypothetical protein
MSLRCLHVHIVPAEVGRKPSSNGPLLYSQCSEGIRKRRQQGRRKTSDYTSDRECRSNQTFLGSGKNGSFHARVP